VEILDLDQSDIELGSLAKKGLKRLARNVAAAPQCDVGVPGSKFRFQSRRQGCFLNAFVNLKQMRMTCADADPDDLRRALWRESPCADQGQKKGMKPEKTPG
jgi:hypothetical protein